MDQASFFNVEQARCTQHEECFNYVHNMLGIIIMSTIAMGTRDVGERNISEAL